MTSLLNKLIIDGLKTAAPYPLDTFLEYFVELVVSQEKQMSRVEVKVDQLIIRPFQTGKRLLEEAKYASTDSRRQELIHRALESFLEIVDLELPQYPLLPIQACFNVGLCHEIHFEKDNAHRWYSTAYERLTAQYGDEVAFIIGHKRHLQEYENRKAEFKREQSKYKKKKQKYDLEKNSYDKAVRQYKESVESLSYLSESDKEQIRRFILNKVANKQARLSPSLPSRRRDSLRSSQLPYQYPLYGSRQLEDLRKLYQILEITRDASKDYAHLLTSNIGLQPYSPPLGERTALARNRHADYLQLGRGIRNGLEPLPSSSLLETLKLILQGENALLKLIQPPSLPTQPVPPSVPQRPDAPESLALLKSLKAQHSPADRTLFSKIVGRWFQQDPQFDKEAVFFAMDLAELLNAIQ